MTTTIKIKKIWGQVKNYFKPVETYNENNNNKIEDTNSKHISNDNKNSNPPTYEEVNKAFLDSLINEGNEISNRCNQKIEEATAKYSFLNTPSKVYQPGGEFHHLIPFLPYDDNNFAQLNKDYFDLMGIIEVLTENS